MSQSKRLCHTSMNSYEITLPFPPSTNTYWRAIGRGRVIISAKGREFREEAVYTAMIERGAIDAEPMEGRLKVFIEAFPPDKRRRDLDNMLKAVLDALEHAKIYENDSQIDDLRIVRMPSGKPGKVVISVEEIDDE